MPQFLHDLFSNDILWVAIISMTFAQFLKPFTYWLRTRDWDWHHIAETGGMPSSHSALVSALAAGMGITQGFGSPYFAISTVLAMIVVYDAAGVRREAGQHARAINAIIAELLSGHPIEGIRLEEVLGHSRKEVMAGVFFGIGVILLWKFVLQPVFI